MGMEGLHGVESTFKSLKTPSSIYSKATLISGSGPVVHIRYMCVFVLFHFIKINRTSGDPVAKTLHSNAEGSGLMHGQGTRSYMQQLRVSMLQLKILHSTKKRPGAAK